MARCTQRTELDVHHIDGSNGNGIGNARVLCHPCHVETGTYGWSGPPPRGFTQTIKDQALADAGQRCQCISNCIACRM